GESMPSMARITRARSAGSSPSAAFACTMRTCSASITRAAGARRGGSPPESRLLRNKGAGGGGVSRSWALPPDAHVERPGAAVADMGVLHARNVGAELRQSQPLWDLALEHAALA